VSRFDRCGINASRSITTTVLAHLLSAKRRSGKMLASDVVEHSGVRDKVGVN